MTSRFSLSHTGDHCQLQGVIDFTTARTALEQTSQLLEANEHLTIDLTDIEHCNSAALALLVELKSVARRTGHQVTFQAIPPGIGELARVCQVESMLV